MLQDNRISAKTIHLFLKKKKNKKNVKENWTYTMEWFMMIFFLWIVVSYLFCEASIMVYFVPWKYFVNKNKTKQTSLYLFSSAAINSSHSPWKQFLFLICKWKSGIIGLLSLNQRELSDFNPWIQYKCNKMKSFKLKKLIAFKRISWVTGLCF